MVATHRESGYALIVAIVATVLVGFAVQAAYSLLQARSIGQQRDWERVNLWAMCDASMAAALAQLSSDASYAGLPRRAFNGGHIASVVRLEGAQRCMVVAQAWYRGRTAVVTASVDLTADGPRVVRWWRGAPVAGSTTPRQSDS